jgi:FlgD Ig-like domain
MRSWKPLLDCCLILCLATPALAASAPQATRSAVSDVVVHGLHHDALGSCVVTRSVDGSTMQLSGIGSTGNDGVSSHLTSMDGTRLDFAKDCDDSDNGASCALSLLWKVDATPPTVCVQSSHLALIGHDRLSCTFPSSLSAMVRLQIRQNDEVVFDSEVSSSTTVDVVRPPGSPMPMPEMEVSMDRVGFTIQARDAYSNGRDMVVGPVVVHGDEVIFSTDCDDVCRAGRVGDSAELRVTSPPSSSFSSLTVAQESVSRFGHAMTALGQCTFVSTPALFTLSGMSTGGLDGVQVTCPRSPSDLSSHVCLTDAVFASPSLLFDPVADNGASVECRVMGSSSCSSTGELASLRCLMSSSGMELQSHFSGACADVESVTVWNAGSRGPRQSISLDGSVFVHAPPGGPLGMAISTKGAPATKSSSGNGIAQTSADVSRESEGRPTVSTSVDGDGLVLHVAFRSSRVFVIGGQQLTGDEVVFKGVHSSGGGGGGGAGVVVTISGMQFRMASSGNPAGRSSMDLLDLQTSDPDNVTPDVPPSSCLSSSHPAVGVPFRISRTSTTPVRAFSVTFHLSSELTLSAPVVEGSYLSSGNPTQMYVTSNGANSYTVDCAILSSSCTAIGNGVLFTVPVSALAGAIGGTGTITVDEVVVRDCSNAPISSSIGSPGHVTLKFSSPTAVSSLTAAQVLSGNDGDGTSKITLSWTPVGDDGTVEVYRAPFGNYPEYDDAPNAGSVPAVPIYPPPALWTLTSVHSSGDVDEPLSRDFYYYVAFFRDACGNVSPVSNRTSGTLNYFLGDVSNGLVACSGDNRVTTTDVSVFGSHYGVTIAPGASFACLDIGPTTDFSPRGRPTTDNKVSFEDLVVISMTYGVVSAPSTAQRPVGAAANMLSLVVPTLPAVGQTFEAVLQYEGAGDAQALSTQLAYDHAVVEAVEVTAGELLARQGRGSLALSSGPGDVDVALLGAGPGIAGRGELARVMFRVKAAGDPQLAIASMVGRDGANRGLIVSGSLGASGDGRTALGIAFPNPFDRSTTVLLSLRSAGRATLAIYDIAGRRVRTLLRGELPAGARTVTWDGRDDAGLQLAAGAYVLRLEAGERTESRMLRLLQ